MKKILAIFLMVVLSLSTLVGCGSKKETIELTAENIGDYISFSKDISGGTYDKSSSTVAGMGFVEYSGSGTYTVNAAANTSASFEKVTITLELVVGDGRTSEQWTFASGGQQVKKYSDDIGRYVKTVTMTIANDGTGSVSENMTLDLSRSRTDVDEMMNRTPSNLSDWGLTYNIVDVSGSVVVEK